MQKNESSDDEFEMSLEGEKHNATYATVLNTKSTIEEDGFTTVKRVKSRRKSPDLRKEVIGTNTSSMLTGVKHEPKVEFFISRLDPSTTPTQIQTYLLKHAGINVQCMQLQTKFNTYASFQITVDKKHGLGTQSGTRF